MAQQNPKQKPPAFSMPFFPIELRPNSQVSQVDSRETAAMKDSAIALALISLNKESYTSRQALLHREARDRLEVSTVGKISKALQL